MLPLDLNLNPGCEYDSLACLPEAPLVSYYAVHYDDYRGYVVTRPAETVSDYSSSGHRVDRYGFPPGSVRLLFASILRQSTASPHPPVCY